MIEVNKLVKVWISKKFIQDVLGNSLKIEKFKFQRDISVAVVGKITIRKLNKKYRKINKATDVLSFGNLKKDKITELIICWPVIKEQAKKFKHSAKIELKFILIHGLLHLLGYRDNTKKARIKMDNETQKILKALPR